MCQAAASHCCGAAPQLATQPARIEQDPKPPLWHRCSCCWHRCSASVTANAELAHIADMLLQCSAATAGCFACLQKTAHLVHRHAAVVLRHCRQRASGLWQWQWRCVGHGQAAVPVGLEGGVGLRVECEGESKRETHSSDRHIAERREQCC